MLHKPVFFNLYSRHLYWDDIADWVARHDHQLPMYHRLCMVVWSWCLGRSLQKPARQ